MLPDYIDLNMLLIIRDFELDHGYAISVRELGERIERSPATVHARLTTLRNAGVIDWIDGEARTTHLTHDGKCALTTERVFGILGGQSNAPA